MNWAICEYGLVFLFIIKNADNWWIFTNKQPKKIIWAKLYTEWLPFETIVFRVQENKTEKKKESVPFILSFASKMPSFLNYIIAIVTTRKKAKTAKRMRGTLKQPSKKKRITPVLLHWVLNWLSHWILNCQFLVGGKRMDEQFVKMKDEMKEVEMKTVK